jgi:peroxiredoxin
VKLLIAEPVPADLAKGGAEQGGGLAAMYFFAGEARPASLRAIEGKPLPPIEAEAWAGEAVEAARLKGRVAVLHFMSSGNGIAMRQAEQLAELERKIGPQGVVVIGVCPPADDLEALAKLAAEGKAPARLCQDRAAEVDEGAPPTGATAAAYGVRYAPATIVIDRAGIVRGAGVKPAKVEELAGLLLAEPIAAAGAEESRGR